MTTPTPYREALLALADRCEKAEGPNYALEVEIFKAIHPEYAGYVQGRGGLVHPYDGSDQRVLSDVRPGNYTASIDAAMALVPADMRDEIEITTLYLVARVTINMNHGPDSSPFYGTNDCNRIPLAICAAALKARALAGDRP